MQFNLLVIDKPSYRKNQLLDSNLKFVNFLLSHFIFLKTLVAGMQQAPKLTTRKLSPKQSGETYFSN